jgi:asparagine synthase (glutamine-hydrolysing)
MAAALAHRGPDDVGIHQCGPFAVLQTRLSIIDLERGHQPMVVDEFALAANGEIYNFVELRRELESRGPILSDGASDSETIVHAYALAGLVALASLHGMFAFALYDRRRRSSCSRGDRLGIKPMYYAPSCPIGFCSRRSSKRCSRSGLGSPSSIPRARAVPAEPIQHGRTRA